jgi:hypothetical protein
VKSLQNKSFRVSTRFFPACPGQVKRGDSSDV